MDAAHEVVRKMFDSYRIEEQVYKGCLSLMILDKFLLIPSLDQEQWDLLELQLQAR